MGRHTRERAESSCTGKGPAWQLEGNTVAAIHAGDWNEMDDPRGLSVCFRSFGCSTNGAEFHSQSCPSSFSQDSLRSSASPGCRCPFVLGLNTLSLGRANLAALPEFLQCDSCRKPLRSMGDKAFLI